MSNLLDVNEQHESIRKILESKKGKDIKVSLNCLIKDSIFSDDQLSDMGRIYEEIGEMKDVDIRERRKLYYDKYSRLTHVVESAQFDIEEIEYYSKLTLSLKDILNGKNEFTKSKINLIKKLLRDKIILNFFIQPSSRTHRSFEAAAKILGAEVINEKDTNFSSLLSRRETLSDTIRTFYNYVDAFVIRTPWNYSTEEAIISQNIYKKSKPVINAGSGRRDHPTQGLLDIITIKEVLGLKNFHQLNGKKIVIVGAKYRRALSSFLKIITKVSPRASYVFVDSTGSLPLEIEGILKSKSISYEGSKELKSGLKGASVVYLACIDGENKNDKSKKYFVSADLLKELSSNAVILHPLPRVNEIDQTTDLSNISGIWKQVENGKYLRAILLLAVFGRIKDLEKIITAKREF